jgi:hypothetical protein
MAIEHGDTCRFYAAATSSWSTPLKTLIKDVFLRNFKTQNVRALRPIGL